MATSVSDTMMRPAQIDYLVRKVSAPKYKMMKIPLNNFPSASAPLDATASVTLEFKLPVRVYNLARSFVSYNINIPATGAGTSSVTYEDVFDLGTSVTFGGAGGQDLMNLQYAGNYTKLARKIGTPLEDFLGNDNITGLYKGGQTSANTVPGGANGGFGSSDSYFEPQYCAISTANTVQNRWRQYPLGAFVGTILGVDRDFYSPVEQYLRITTSPGRQVTFSTSAAATFATPLAIAGVTCNQVYLYLCVEQNPEIIASIISTTQAGAMRYRIPYTTAFRNVGGPGSSGQTNVQIQLSQQYGLRLRRILHSVFNPVEQLNTSYDCNNFNGLKIGSYQTFLDSMPQQDRILSCLSPAGMMINQDDWAENKKYLDTRSCYVSKEMYALNWFHIDSWCEPLDNEGVELPDVNKDEGLLMDSSKQWQFSAISGTAAPAGLIHYTYAEFSREIVITADGPKWVSGQ